LKALGTLASELRVAGLCHVAALPAYKPTVEVSDHLFEFVFSDAIRAANYWRDHLTSSGLS
jgi:hypothetical protein